MAAVQATTSLIGQWGNAGRSAYEESRSHQRGPSQSGAGVFSGEDRVELSADAPRPLDARALEDALALGDSGDSSGEGATQLRQDRVYMAVAVLAAIARQGVEPQWSGGLPAPTRAELAAAYRRIHQRMSRMDEVRNPKAMLEIRREIIDSEAVRAAVT